ncbi:MAG: protein TolR [Nitrospinaceae bacterium]|nr:protein TolR [Nitrospinaceae bacterium]MBT3433880.1 protein TolR [Nitrospinaceae bacterium]MBT3823176.1 protein TolR [Nitrospinaceae bacterium]MBT4093102.1 protein TolR [Nitrospinaceae bacterium]MBT4429021.1 protein TolR [Nitrospinaceae bacterium]
MLVLLIIFMVTAPMLQQSQSQVNVDLPNVLASPATAAEDAVIITVDLNSRVFINDSQVQPADLGEKLSVLFKSRSKKEIFLRADQNVPYGEVVKTMAVIRKAGITRLNMVTESLKSKSKKTSSRR